jgi:hypothetical protein
MMDRLLALLGSLFKVASGGGNMAPDGARHNVPVLSQFRQHNDVSRGGSCE